MKNYLLTNAVVEKTGDSSVADMISNAVGVIPLDRHRAKLRDKLRQVSKSAVQGD